MDFVLAQNLSYYVAMSPTPGTPAAFAVNAVVSETAGYFLMMKNNAQSGGQRLHLDYLALSAAWSRPVRRRQNSFSNPIPSAVIRRGDAA